MADVGCRCKKKKFSLRGWFQQIFAPCGRPAQAKLLALKYLKYPRDPRSSFYRRVWGCAEEGGGPSYPNCSRVRLCAADGGPTPRPPPPRARREEGGGMGGARSSGGAQRSNASPLPSPCALIGVLRASRVPSAERYSPCQAITPCIQYPRLLLPSIAQGCGTSPGYPA